MTFLFHQRNDDTRPLTYNGDSLHDIAVGHCFWFFTQKKITVRTICAHSYSIVIENVMMTNENGCR